MEAVKIAKVLEEQQYGESHRSLHQDRERQSEAGSEKLHAMAHSDEEGSS